MAQKTMEYLKDIGLVENERDLDRLAIVNKTANQGSSETYAGI